MSQEKTSVRRWTEIGIAAVVLAGVFVWSEGLLLDKVGPGFRVEAAERELPPGPTVKSERRILPVEIELLGTVRPVRDAAIAARIMGRVLAVHVEEGDTVAAEDLLVELEAPELEARGAAARNQVQAARARLDQALRDLERMQALEARGAATAVELERAQTEAKMARASLASAREAAQGEETVASYITIRAPMAGRIVERLVDPGDLATPGLPLLRLEGEGAFRLEVPMDERLAATVRVGDVAAIRLDSLAARLEGRVGEIRPTADPDSRTVVVKIDLPAEIPGLRSGLFGRARMIVDRREGVVVPEAAVRRVGGLAVVRVVMPDGSVLSRHVRLGPALDGDRVEILSGLEGGETLVLAEGDEKMGGLR